MYKKRISKSSRPNTQNIVNLLLEKQIINQRQVEPQPSIFQKLAPVYMISSNPKGEYMGAMGTQILESLQFAKNKRKLTREILPK